MASLGFYRGKKRGRDDGLAVEPVCREVRLGLIRASLRLGPSSVSELVRGWPLQIVQGLRETHGDDDGHIYRLCAHQRIRFITDYSGMDCPRQAWEEFMKSLKESEPLAHNMDFRFCRSCDIGDTQTSLLVAMAKADAESPLRKSPCHHTSIAGRLPMKARNYIVSAAPDPEAPLEDRIAGHQHIREWIWANRSWVFPANATSECAVHPGQRCPAFPWGDSDDDEPGPQATRSRTGRGRSTRATISGVTCVAWSQQGLQEGPGHASEIPHWIWHSERRVMALRRAEDIGFFECTKRYPVVERLVEGMADTHRVVYIRFGSWLMGWPHERFRLLAALINHLTMLWVGPTDQNMIERDFLLRFGRRTLLAGSSLLTASTEERFEYYAELANNRPGQKGAKFTGAELREWSPDELKLRLGPAGWLERFIAWEEQRDLYHVPLPGRDFMADLDQWPEHGKHNKPKNRDGAVRFGAGNRWPTQLTHGSIAALAGDGGWRLATPKEHLAALGVPVHDPQNRLLGFLSELGVPHHRIKMLAGNGMHLHLIGAWLAYVLSNTIPKPADDPFQDDILFRSQGQLDEWDD